MGHFNRSTLVDCPPHQVFGVLEEVERLTEFSGMTVEVKGPGRTLVDYDLPLGILGDAVDAVYLHSKHEEQAEEIRATLKAICESST